jgi:dolichol-phosphate mannosyltransferase
MPGSLLLSVLLPVRNETLNLRVMLRILSSVIVCPHETLVVFDSRSDASAAVVEEMRASYPHLRPIVNEIGAGVAGAIRSGVEAARGERILIFAADEVGPVLAIEDMLALMDEGVEFVSVTRYAHGGRRLGGSRIGHLLSRAANWLLHTVFGAALSDSTTGIKMFRRRDFNALANQSSSVGWTIAFEMAINAQLTGLKLGEVPTISIDRLFGGKSSFRLISWIIAYLDIFMIAVRMLPRSTESAVRVRIPLGM